MFCFVVSKTLLSRQFKFKVDRLRITVVAKKYIYVSQLFISRMPKMSAIPPQMVVRLWFPFQLPTLKEKVLGGNPYLLALILSFQRMS